MSVQPRIADLLPPHHVYLEPLANGIGYRRTA